MISSNPGGTETNVLTYDNTDVRIFPDVVMDKDLQMSDGKITIDQQTISNASSTITFNPSLGSNAKVTLNGDKTLAMSGWVTGDTGVLLVEQGSGTTYTVTLPGGSVVIGGSTYTTTTTSGGIDVLGVYYDGTSYYWSIPGGGVGEKGAKGDKGSESTVPGSGNELLTSDGGGGITAETNFTFDGSTAILDGNLQIIQQTLTDASIVSWNLDNGSNAKVTLGGSRTLGITNMNTGDTGVILVKQGTGTTHTLSLPGGSVIIGGGTYTTTTTSGGVDVLGVYYDGTNYYWSIPGGASGAKGEKGATGTGEKGAQGAQGAQGATGTGEKGAQGADGGSGTSIGSAQVAFSNGTNLVGESDFIYDTTKNTLTVDKIKVGSAGGSFVDGMIRAGNDIVAFATSDKRLKENIKPIENALDKIQSISGNNFTWKPLITKEEKTIHANEGPDVGVIAQEIEKVLPEVVTTRSNGYKAVNYEKIVALLIEAIKEQQIQIDELKTKINE